MASRGAIGLYGRALEVRTIWLGGLGATLKDAAGALLWPRGLGAQDGPDRLIEDGFQASLGEG